MNLSAAFVDFWAMEGIALLMFMGLAFLEGLIFRIPAKLKPPAELLTDLFYWTTAPILRQLETIVSAVEHCRLETHPRFFDHFVEGCQFRRFAS